MFTRTRTVALAVTLTATAALGLIAAAPASAQEPTSFSVVIASSSSGSDAPSVHSDQVQEAKQSTGTQMPVFMLVGLAAIFGSILLVVGSGNRKTARRRP